MDIEIKTVEIWTGLELVKSQDLNGKVIPTSLTLSVRIGTLLTGCPVQIILLNQLSTRAHLVV